MSAEPGIFPQLSMNDYLSMQFLSSGLVNTILSSSPYHAKWEQEHRVFDDTKASDAGSAIHSALLEGIDLLEIIVPEDYRSKPNKANPEGAIPKGWTNNAIRAARDEARINGKIPILKDDAQNVRNAVDAACEFMNKNGCEIQDCFMDGAPEVTGIWAEDEVFAKMRCDWLSDKWHISVKTTEGSANPESWVRRQMGPMGYDVQLMFYERGLLALGRNVESRILLIEQKPPYGCAVFGLAPSRSEYAAARCNRAIETWKACVKSGRYPAYSAQTHFAEAMPWESAAQEQDIFTDEELKGGLPA